MKRFIVAAALLSMTAVAIAAPRPLELASCADVGASLENMLMGPDNQKSYYNGNVGLIAYDTIEPAAASYGVAIVFNEPVETPEGFILRKCLAVPYLSGISLKDAQSTYNAKTGVTILIPIRKSDGITGEPRDTKISINIKTVNTGTIAEGHVVTAEEI